MHDLYANNHKQAKATLGMWALLRLEQRAQQASDRTDTRQTGVKVGLH